MFEPFVFDDSKAAPKSRKRWFDLSLLGPIIVIVTLLQASFAFFDGLHTQAFYSGGFAILLGFGLLIWSYMRATPVPGRQLADWRVAGLFAVGFCVFLAMRSLPIARVPTPEEITGSNEAKEYRNQYFNFCIPYGDQWVNTTAKGTRDLAEMTRGDVRKPILLLSLAQSENEESLVIVAESLPDRFPKSGREFLKQTVAELQTEWESPAVHWEHSQTVANLKFDRVTVKVKSSGHEQRVTYWATVHRQHALMIWGNYETQGSLNRIEKLLDRATTLPSNVP